MDKEAIDRLRHEIASATHKLADAALGADKVSKLDICVIRNAMNIGAQLAVRALSREADQLVAFMKMDAIFKELP